MTQPPDADTILKAIDTLAHCPTDLTDDEPTDYRLKILVRQAQDYIQAAGPIWRAWQARMDEQMREQA